MISSTSTKNISPRGTHCMTAPSVAAAITVTASRAPSTRSRRVCGRVGHGNRHRDDQARAGDDLRLHAPLRRFAMAVQHGQPAERGIDGEVEAADGIERQQRQADRQGHPYGALDIVAIDVGKQATHPLIVLERSKDGLTMPYQDLRAFLTDPEERRRARRHRAADRRQVRHRQGARQDQLRRGSGADVHADRDGLPAGGRASTATADCALMAFEATERPSTPRC